MTDDLTDRLHAAMAAYRAVETVDRALHDADQCRSFVRGLLDRDGPPNILADEVRWLRVALTASAGEIEALSKKVYQPGVFKCAKCSFELVQKTLNANTGSVTARDAVGEKCPNDGSPMWRVSYQEDNAKAWKWGEEEFDRAQAAEAARDQALARVAELEAALTPSADLKALTDGVAG